LQDANEEVHDSSSPRYAAAAAAAAVITSSEFNATASLGVARAAAVNNNIHHSYDDDDDEDDDEDEEDDRKPAAKPTTNDNKSSDDNHVSNSTANKDNRFVCAICLETVSDEPVVTRCGHLYCWPCLYQWLQPGMLLSEYRAAFGSPTTATTTTDEPNHNGMMPNRNSSGTGATASGNSHGGGGGGLNFLSEMTTSYNNQNQQAAAHAHAHHDRPYNPAGGIYNERRRCCPICKAGCTVDSVIPIYIHVHSTTKSEVGSPSNDNSENVGLPTTDRNNYRSMDSIDSLDVDNESRSETLSHAEQSSPSPMFAAAAATATPHGSPTDTNTTDSLLSMNKDEPTSVNLGLRQRRRPTSSSATRKQSDAQSFVCESPKRKEHDILGGFDNQMSNQHTDNVNVGGNTNNPSVHNTPVHRNSSRVRDDDDVAQIPINATAAAAANVPSRPVPTSPWMANRSAQPQQNIHRDQHEHDQRTNTIQPDLNEQQTSPIPSSSPFRLALRPRHQNQHALTAPTQEQQWTTGIGSSLGRPQGQRIYSQSYPNHHHRHGRLTSALLGIVDTIDSHLANTSHHASSSGASDGARESQPPISTVPPLHRSDGGLGGIGRASEQSNHRGNADDGNGMIEEESSLAMAREFLSRLLLMLACFVVLCLLLF